MRSPNCLRSVLPLVGVFAMSACDAADDGASTTVDPSQTGSTSSATGTSSVNPTGTGGSSTTSGATSNGQVQPGISSSSSSTSTNPATGGATGSSATTAPSSTSTTGNGTSSPDTSDTSTATDATSDDAELPAGGYPENTGAGCDVEPGELSPNQKLPDPFKLHDGTRITTKAQWACRRNEIKRNIEMYEIGPKPEPSPVEASLSGDTLTVNVTTPDGTLTLTSKVATMSGENNCIAIGMNGNSGLISGCVQVPFMHDDVVKYGQNSTQNQSDPFYEVYPDSWKKIGNYSAWSWGISRLIDGIEQVKDELKVDTSKIGVHGCSYAGKMALFAGAFDERIALTIAQESGGGGINAWRTSDEFNQRTRTDIEKINNTNYSWFMQSMQQLDPYSLPHDHHELIAMIAPRAFLTLGNQDYEWLGDESGYKSVNAAKEVWKAFGVPDHIGYDFTSNHGHCAAPTSQKNAATAFVDRFLKGKDADTEITVQPQEGNFDLDWEANVDWETPTLQ